jgi:hypothetical protein
VVQSLYQKRLRRLGAASGGGEHFLLAAVNASQSLELRQLLSVQRRESQKPKVPSAAKQSAPASGKICRCVGAEY